MLPPNNPDRIRIVFDDHRLVANAGLGPAGTRDHHLDLGGAPGRANTGDKMLTLVASGLAATASTPPPWAPSCAAFAGGMSVNSTA